MNSIFHINVFSQIPLAPSSPIEGRENMAVAPIEEGKSSTNRIRTAVATGLLALSLSAGAQERPTATAMTDTQPMLLAQANMEDGRIGPYPLVIPQVSGGSKMVEYFRDKNGSIIAPPVIDGKLIDGSIAPGNPIEARVAQKKILAKYEKIILVKAEKIDFVNKMNKDIGYFYTLAEQGKLSKDQLFTAFYSTYVVLIGLGSDNDAKSIDGLNTILNGLGTYGKISLKLQPSEIQSMKQKAEQKAKEELQRYSSVTA